MNPTAMDISAIPKMKKKQTAYTGDIPYSVPTANSNRPVA